MAWKLDDDFKETEASLREGATKAARKTAQKVLKRAQAAAPVKTGALRDSGRVVETDEGAEVVFDAPYADVVETGFFDLEGGKEGTGAFRAGAHFLGGAMANSREDLEDQGAALLRDLGAK